MDLQEQEQMVNDLELGIDRLRALYEQYFMGIEKLEPNVPRKQVERLMQTLRRTRLNNTALRFRFQQLVQRYSTMQTYWRRVCRQIEEGTYRRDVMRARARAEEALAVVRKRMHGEGEDAVQTPEHDVDLDEFDDTNPGAPSPELLGRSSGTWDPEEVGLPRQPAAERQPSMKDLLSDPLLGRPVIVEPPRSAPPQSAPPQQRALQHRPPPPPPEAFEQRSAPASLAVDRVQAIYRDYISARQRCNQSTQGMTFEKVSAQIKVQEEALRAKHGKEVDFQVSVRDGKAILKAVQKKS